MAITYFGSASNPADSGDLGNEAARAVTPPSSMVADDLIFVTVQLRGSGASAVPAVSNTGGQSWNTGTAHSSSSPCTVIFWAVFNGTWSADPSWATSDTSGIGLTIKMDVYRPTSASYTWSVGAAESATAYSAPSTPFDVTATGQTPDGASSVTIAVFNSTDDNTWALQTGGWTNAGNAQYRNTRGSDMSLSVAYLIQTSIAATGNVTNRQATLGGDAGWWIIITFKETLSQVNTPRARFYEMLRNA